MNEKEFVVYKNTKIYVDKDQLWLNGLGITNLDEVEGLFDLKAVKKLDLFQNSLTILPDAIGNLVSLEELFLFENKLERIPDSIGKLTNLNALSFSNNHLVYLPESIGQLKSLQELTLENNKLKTLPESFSNLASLQDLRLTNNQLVSLPESFGNLKLLNHCYLNGNKLTELPASIADLKQLRTFFIQDNKILTLPDTISELGQVENLVLRNNPVLLDPDSKTLDLLLKLGIKSQKVNADVTIVLERDRINVYVRGELFEVPESQIPKTQFSSFCSKMRVWLEHDYSLGLMDSQIAFPVLRSLIKTGDLKVKRILPQEIYKRLLNNDYQILPYFEFLEPEQMRQLMGEVTINKKFEFISKLVKGGHIEKCDAKTRQHLIDLLDQNDIKYISRDKRIIGIVIEDRLDLTDFDIQNLDQIENIKNLTFVKELNLSKNKLKTLPEWISNFKSLEKLNLNYNNFIEIPKPIGSLSALKELKMEDNDIRKFPEFITGLKNLEALSLDSNKIKTIPSSIENLKTLQELDLSSNPLTTLPESIGHLNALKRIILLGSRITEIPPSIVNLQNLEEVDLTYTPVADTSDEKIKEIFKKLEAHGVSLALWQ